MRIGYIPGILCTIRYSLRQDLEVGTDKPVPSSVASYLSPMHLSSGVNVLLNMPTFPSSFVSRKLHIQIVSAELRPNQTAARLESRGIHT